MEAKLQKLVDKLKNQDGNVIEVIVVIILILILALALTNTFTTKATEETNSILNTAETTVYEQFCAAQGKVFEKYDTATKTIVCKNN